MSNSKQSAVPSSPDAADQDDNFAVSLEDTEQRSAADSSEENDAVEPVKRARRGENLEMSSSTDFEMDTDSDYSVNMRSESSYESHGFPMQISSPDSRIPLPSVARYSVDEDVDYFEMTQARSSSPAMGDAAETSGSPEAPRRQTVRQTPTVNVSQLCRERMFDRDMHVPPKFYCQKLIGNVDFVKRLSLKFKMNGHEGCVNSLGFNDRGTRLASGSDDLHVIVWDWPVNKALARFQTGHRLNVFQSKFLPNTNDLEIVTSSRDGQVRLCELGPDGNCQVTRQLACHTSTSHKLTIDHESPNLVLSCGEDARVYEIDTRLNREVELLKCTSQTNGRLRSVALYSIHMHPRNSNVFVVSGDDKYCRLYDRRFLADSQPVQMYSPSPSSFSNPVAVTCAVFNHNGSEILATYQDNDIYLFDSAVPNRLEPIKQYKGHRNSATVKGVNFYGPESQFVVSGSDCGHIFFWDKQSQEVIKYMVGDDGGVVNVLEPHPNFATLATSGLDSDVKIWTPTGEREELSETALRQLMDRNRDFQPPVFDRVFQQRDVQFVYQRLRAVWNANDGDEESDSEPSNESVSSEDSDEPEVAINCRPS